MTPEKFFDYLEGKLPPAEKERLERALISDPELQRQLVTAREIHRGLQRLPNEQTDSAAIRRAGRRGPQLAAAVALLVALNVGIGLFFIFRNGGPPEQYRREKQNSLRAPLERAVEQAASTAFTPPTIGPEQIVLKTGHANQEALATSIIAAAQKAGGSGIKTLPNEKGVNVLVDLPAAREADFRAALTALGAPSPPPTLSISSGSPNDIVHLEIVISAPD